MAQIVGYVKAVEGTFYAKGPDGTVRELKAGDPIYAKDFIYDPSHDPSHELVIDLTRTADDLVIDGKAELVFDDTVADTRIALDETLSEADVVSSLREVGMEEGDALDDLLKSYGDIDVDETALGEEDVQPRSSAYNDQFATESGATADVQSGLRTPASHDYTLAASHDPFDGRGTTTGLTTPDTPGAAVPPVEPTVPPVLPPLPPQPPLDTGTANTIAIVDPNGDGVLNAREASSLALAGTVEPGSTIDAITVTDGTTTLTVPASAITYDPATGAYRVEGVDLSPLQDGAITVAITSTDAAGNSATSTATIQKDTTPPTLSVDAPDVTNDPTPVITGYSSEPNGWVTVEVTDANGNTQSMLVATDANGDFSVEVPHPLPDGNYDVKASVTDAAGNRVETADTGNIVDTTPPTLGITLGPVTDDNVLNAAEAGGEVVLSGKVTGDFKTTDTVTVTVNGREYTTTPGADGTFAVAVPGSELAADPDARIEAKVSSTDAAGNETTATAAQAYTVDTASPTVTLDEISDDFINATEHGQDLLIGGTTTGVEDGQTVSVVFNGQTYTGVVSGGSFSVTVPAADVQKLADGQSYVATATVSDKAGNVATDIEDVTIDLTPPTLGITLDPVTDDNVLNAAEAGGDVVLSGKVTGDFKTTDTVTVTVNGKEFTTTPDANGNFRVTVPGQDLTADGDLTVDAKIATADAAGNETTATAAQTYTVDTTPPALGIQLLHIADDQYVNEEETHRQVAIEGKVTGDFKTTDDVVVTIGDPTKPDATYTVHPQADGTFTLEVDGQLLADVDRGHRSVQAQVTTADDAGNTTTKSTSMAYYVDTTPPTLTVDAPDLTNDTTPVITGTGSEPNSEVTLEVTDANGKTQTFTTITDANGDFSVEVPHPLPEGDYDVKATITDKAGNTTNAVDTGNTVDTTPPGAPTVTIKEDRNDDGYINKEEMKGYVDVHIDLSNATAGDTLHIVHPDGTTSDVAITPYMVDHGYNLKYDQTADGTTLTVQAQYIDPAGNEGPVGQDSATLDLTKPTLAIDTVAGDDKVDDGEDESVTLAGTTDAEPGQVVTVSVTDAGGTTRYTGSATVENDGTWKVDGIDMSTWPDGTDYTVTASVTDKAGNSAQTTHTFTTVDTTPPTLDITVDDTALSRGETATVTFTFSEAVQGFDVADVKVTGGTLSGLQQDSSDPTKWTATFTPDDNYEGKASIEVADGSYTDLAGNAGTGDSEALTVDTVPPRPTIDLDADITADDIVNAAESKQDIPVTGTVDGDAKVGDIVTLTINGQSYDATVYDDKGVLRFKADVKGSDLAADADRTVEAVVTTTDAAGNVGTAGDTEGYVVDTTPPTVQVSVDDDHLTGGEIAEVVFDFSEVPVGFDMNDIQVTGGTLSDLEQDPDNPTKWTATFRPADGYEGDASIEVVDAGYTDAAQNPGSGGKATLTVNTKFPDIQLDKITGDNYLNEAEAQGQVKITGSVKGPFKEGDTVIVNVNGVDYTTTVKSDKSFSVTVDGSELAADADHSVKAKVISADNPKDTDSTGISYIVDTTPPGAPVVEIVEDADNDSYIDSKELNGDIDVKVTLPANAKAGDTLILTNPDGMVIEIEVTQEMIDDGFRVSYDATEGETLTVSAKLRDPAGNESGTSEDTATINATAPTFEDENGTEVDAYVFEYDENGTTDTVLGRVRAEDAGGDEVHYSIAENVKDADGNDLYAIDPQTGEITLTEAGAASFANDYEADGNSHRIVVVASDGVNETEVEVTLNERNLNDNAPVPSDASVSTDEDTPYLFTPDDFPATDADRDDVSAVRVETLPAEGRLEYFSGREWVAVSEGDEIAVADIADGKLRYVPAQNASGENYASFDFKVFDGEHWSEESGSVTVSVAPVVDGPDLSFSLGKDLYIDSSNVEETGGGYAVKAFRADGSEGEVAYNPNPEGFGVEGDDATGASSELGYNYDLESSEKLVVSFDGLVKAVDVSFAWVNENETAAWTFMRDGVVVGTGTHTGGSDEVDPPITIAPESGEAFDTVVFHTIHNPDYEDDDYLIHSIEAQVLGSDTFYVQEGETIHFNVDASLIDTDGSEELTRVEVSGLPSGATLSDGDHTFTADDDNDGVEITDWNLSSMTLELPEVDAASTARIRVEAETVETATGETKTAEQSVELTILDAADKVFVFNGDPVEGSDGFDVLVTHEDIDLSALEEGALKNIEKIDMSDASSTVVTSLTLEDIVEMTDDDNTLVIDGDSVDEVDIPDNWDSKETVNGYDIYTYSNPTSDGDPTVTLKIDQDIQHG